MKTKILKNYINRAIVLTRKVVLPIFEYALVKDGTMTIGNLETYHSIKVDFGYDKPFLFPVKELKQVLAALDPEDNIKLQPNGNQSELLINNRPSYTFQVEDEPDQYPVMPEVDGNHCLQVDAETVTKLKGLLKFCSTNELRPAMTGVYFGEDVVVTNAYILKKLPIKSEQVFIIPRYGIALLLKQDYDISINTTHAKIESASETIVTRHIEEKYPDYKKVIPQHESSIKISRVDLIRQVRLAAVCANKITQQVVLNIYGDSLQIKTRNLDTIATYNSPDIGVELQTRNAPIRNREIIISVNARFLLSLLNAMPNEDFATIEFGLPTQALLINGHSLLMPVMIDRPTAFRRTKSVATLHTS